MRENETGKSRIPNPSFLPPDDGEIDEIIALLGDDAPQGSSASSDDGFALDDILKEYNVPLPVDSSTESGTVPGDSPSPDESPEESAPASSGPAEVPGAEASPEAAPASPEAAPEAPAPSEPAPEAPAHPEPEEEPDVRDTIADQVTRVMEQKKARSERAPRAARRASEPEYAEQTPVTHSGPRVREPEGPALCDDLRSFRGLSPADALSKAKSAVGYYRWRSWVVLLLSLLSAYISCAPTYGLPLPSFISYVRLPFVYLFILNVLLLAAMFLSVSLLADGVRMLFRKRFKAETLLFFSCLATLLYTMRIMTAPTSGGYLPYHAVVSLNLYFAMLTRLLRYRNIVNSCRALTRSSGRYAAINGSLTSDGHVRTVYKQEPAGLERRMMDRLWEEDRVERFLGYYSPLALLLTCVLAAAASLINSERVSFLWAWSALLSAALPGGLLTAYILPSVSVSGRLAQTGTVVAGPGAADTLSGVESCLLCERDLFPLKMISISSVKVFSGFTPEKVNLCALSVLKASGSSLHAALAASLSRVPLNMPLMENFEFYETGGMGAYVNSDRVLVGTANFILRSGIRIPEGINLKSGIFVAINAQFAGLYPVKYDVQPSVRRALGTLVRHHLTPVLAVRDFNITPQLVESKFRLPPRSTGYPELGDRISYSSMHDGLEDEPLAALAVDTTANYADAVTSGRRIRSASHVNLIIGLVSGVLGLVLNFFLLYKCSASSITPIHVFYYILLWFVPTLLVSFAANRR